MSWLGSLFGQKMTMKDKANKIAATTRNYLMHRQYALDHHAELTKMLAEARQDLDDAHAQLRAAIPRSVMADSQLGPVVEDAQKSVVQP